MAEVEKSKGGTLDYLIVGDIKCEVDGERLAGVHYVAIEIDREGNHRLMMFTDPRILASLRPTKAWRRPAGLEKMEDDSNKKEEPDLVGGAVMTGSGSFCSVKPVGNSEWPHSCRYGQAAPVSFRIPGDRSNEKVMKNK